MKILVTGANGFIGKNLIAELNNINEGKVEGCLLEGESLEIYCYDTKNTKEDLNKYTRDCDFVFHLAGINRPKDPQEFKDGNQEFTNTLLKALERHSNKAPIVLSSSVQAALDNPYGASKKAGEDILFRYAKEKGTKVWIYRFQNVFGKWCRPNYNSVVATFCYNIARDIPIEIRDPEAMMNLVYIDDVMTELITNLSGKVKKNKQGFSEIPIVYTVKLGKIAELIKSFKDSRSNLEIPDMSDSFTKKLYATYLSYLPEEAFNYPLKMNIDSRGSFTEFIRTPDRGQISINIIKAGITKGNHWHHTKNEKFLVIQGEGLIQFRKINEKEIREYHVTGESLEVIDIPIGYTHNIINEGENDLVTIMWANEVFDSQKPDTYFLEV